MAQNLKLHAADRSSMSDELGLDQLPIYKAYKSAKYLSGKHSSYFDVYEELLSPFRGKKFTFVEIGVANGGSLLMWRDYFGPDARIIGLDFNPEAKRFESDGFEIHIGNQADLGFWKDFFAKIGKVDVILDDGGHTNRQQIITAHACIPEINDGGVLIIEDTHTSYFKAFGNPSRYSFINYAKSLIDAVNSRSPEVHASRNPLKSMVHSIRFYESIVSFHIDRRKAVPSVPTNNDGVTFKMKDFRRHGTPKLVRFLQRRAARMGFDPFGLKKYF